MNRCAVNVVCALVGMKIFCSGASTIIALDFHKVVTCNAGRFDLQLSILCKQSIPLLFAPSQKAGDLHAPGCGDQWF